MTEEIEFYPVGDRILLIRCEAEDTYGEGDVKIFIPETARELPLEYTIYKVGEGRYNKETGTYEPSRHKPGDRIFLNRYVGHEVELPEIEYPVMVAREEDILMSNNPDFRGEK